jgi:hypothetical protein
LCNQHSITVPHLRITQRILNVKYVIERLFYPLNDLVKEIYASRAKHYFIFLRFSGHEMPNIIKPSGDRE